MAHSPWCAIGASVILLALPSLAAAAAEAQRVQATIDKPAVVTAIPAPADEATAGSSRRIVIKVTGFQPAEDGPVQVVVKAQRNDKEQEIGRFGIFPYRPFTAADHPKGQTFGLPLPKDLASGGPVKLYVYLVPANGQGKGASVEIGSAEIR